MNYQKFCSWALTALVLVGCYTPLPPHRQPASVQSPHASERLGTQWGDEVQSSVNIVQLQRLQSQPIDERVVRYSAKDYRGQSLNNIALVSGKVEWAVRDDAGKTLPLFRENGHYYLRGQAGQAYRLVYRNHSANTYELVVSVDGVDVINGSTASRQNRGYVLRPHSSLTIEGFRKSRDAVASFVFGTPQSAYANQTEQGSIRNVGVIGTAVFELHAPKSQASDEPEAFPADKGYAKPPR